MALKHPHKTYLLTNAAHHLRVFGLKVLHLNLENIHSSTVLLNLPQTLLGLMQEVPQKNAFYIHQNSNFNKEIREHAVSYKSHFLHNDLDDQDIHSVLLICL